MKQLKLHITAGIFFALFAMAGCEDSVTSTTHETISVESYDNLQECKEEDKGTTAIVESANSMYFCNGNTWVEMSSKDTIYIKPDTSVVFDTLVKIDSIKVIEKDTIHSIDTLVIKETIRPVEKDTIYSIDTLIIKDTIYRLDSIVNLIRDTVYNFDTLVVKDSLLVINNDTIYIDSPNSCKIRDYGDFPVLICENYAIRTASRNSIGCWIKKDNYSFHSTERLVLYCNNPDGDTLVAGIYDKKCETVYYNSLNQFCYKKKIFDKCNGEEYDPDKEFCWYYDRTVHPRCNGKDYYPPVQRCVDGEVVSF